MYTDKINKIKFVLASSSTYRKSLLEKLGLPFVCHSPDIDESISVDELPEAAVQRLSVTKAKVTQPHYQGHYVIASDQVAIIAEDPAGSTDKPAKIMGKPHTIEAAVSQLKNCSGKTVRFYTGLTLISPDQNVQTKVESFDVKFRPLSDQQINFYIKTELPLNCAGSFKSEGLGITLFESLSGRDPNTLIGLPLILLCDMLLNAGINVLSDDLGLSLQ